MVHQLMMYVFVGLFLVLWIGPILLTMFCFYKHFKGTDSVTLGDVLYAGIMPLCSVVPLLGIGVAGIVCIETGFSVDDVILYRKKVRATSVAKMEN